MMDALILAGGENRRIPVLKGFIKIQDKKIIERNLNLLRQMFSKVIISTNSPELYFYLGAQMIGDVLSHRGPMTGIYSVLININSPFLFVTACDMPYINVILIKYIADKADERYDAIIPLYENRSQPLLGVYSKRIAGKMENSIIQGKRSLRDFLKELVVYYINEEEIRKIDPFGRSFVNINTIEDYKREGGSECLV
ncbi:MAG: molybdenum cofactor guanylyltransferase [Nitrospirae bacterium]|jgi:molybdopterin-guanine dinucleotide biosynthesis protein A|nr:molybdenum cofactor guanylyltransferase [Nitrospirota bacterium]